MLADSDGNCWSAAGAVNGSGRLSTIAQWQFPTSRWSLFETAQDSTSRVALKCLTGEGDGEFPDDEGGIAGRDSGDRLVEPGHLPIVIAVGVDELECEAEDIGGGTGSAVGHAGSLPRGAEVVTPTQHPLPALAIMRCGDWGD